MVFAGSNGKVTTDFGSPTDFAHGIVLQADGKIVVVGESGTDLNTGFALARYNPERHA
jgi:hypothetical protein